MNYDNLENEYFEWLYDQVCDGKNEHVSYRELFTLLHSIDFRWCIPRDENRAEDGIDLRYRFAIRCDERNEKIILRALNFPCSVFEMIFALAIRCEETIMDDPSRGNRTKQWFWRMINNLELGGMYDSRFDKYYVIECVERLLDREYAPNGEGGLFTIKHCKYDLRTVEIWTQLCWYLDDFMGE